MCSCCCRGCMQLVRRCKAHLVEGGKIWDQPRGALVAGLCTCARYDEHYSQRKLQYVCPPYVFQPQVAVTWVWPV